MLQIPDIIDKIIFAKITHAVFLAWYLIAIFDYSIIAL